VREESANNLEGSAAQRLQKDPKMSLQETPGINMKTYILML